MWYWWLGREMRGRGKCREGLSGMSSKGWKIWNIKIDWVASLFITSRITLLWTFLEQLILIWHLIHHDSHNLEAVSHSSLSQVINQAIFPFISYFSHDESLCFILLLMFFLIYHLIHHTVLTWNFLEYFSDSLLNNCLQIPEMLLSCSCSPPVEKGQSESRIHS